MTKRRAWLTPNAALAAIEEWLNEEMGLICGSSVVRIVGKNTWLEFRDIVPRSPNVPPDPTPVLRSLLWTRPMPNQDTMITDEVMVIHLYDSDPTPVIDRSRPGIFSQRVPLPWQTIALVQTSDGIEARNCELRFPDWGVREVWPFSD